MLLTGHAEKNEDMIRQSANIVIAEFTNLGSPGADGSGEDSYSQAEITVISTLKGTLSGKLEVDYSVFLIPGKDQEATPAIGVSYIMFIGGLNQYVIKKLLPATEANITSVKMLLKPQPGH